jgi:predicted transposase/invertase (TIGR01784 family)
MSSIRWAFLTKNNDLVVANFTSGLQPTNTVTLKLERSLGISSLTNQHTTPANRKNLVKPMSLQNPHDHFFRESFSRIEIARDYLQQYLPAPLLAQLDLSEMSLQDGSFVDDALKEHQTDILYEIRLQSGSPAFVYFLFEHKSYTDRMVAYQLLRYQMRVWERQVKADNQLFPIIPIVLYHGAQPWTIPTDFASLYFPANTPPETVEAFQPHLLNFQYHLGDFSYLSDEEIRGEIWLRVGLSVLRTIFDPDLRDELAGLIRLVFELQRQRTGLEYIRTILYYLTTATSKVSRAELRHVLQTATAQGEKLMGTIAEEYIQEGKILGRQEGRQEGLQEGIQKTMSIMREDIAELLAVRLGIAEEESTAVLATITDFDTLRRVLRLSATAVSSAEYQQGLQELLS